MKNTTKKTHGTAEAGLKLVQYIIKTCKDRGEQSCSRKKCGWNEILNHCDHKKFNSESKSTMQRELKVSEH